MAIDYSLYLVTDSTPAILGDKDLPSIVEAALQGGVTIVQYRDKTSDIAELIRMGERLHAITKRHNVPLLINDHVGVAQAIGAEGVHLGQDDMDLQTARRILGPDAIIGVSANNMFEAVEAATGGANYLGIGTIYATPTKENTKSIIGTAGVRDILWLLSQPYHKLPTVAIGGLNASNIQRVIYQSKSPSKGLDGVAVVSAIMAAADPEDAAAALRRLIDNVPTTMSPKANENQKVETLLSQIPSIVKKLGQTNPLCHNMTNLVVQNFAANVALSIGASPIMANYGEEAKDLAALGGALVINMGTVTPDGLLNYTSAMRAYNEVGGPILFDPVGAGATEIRRNAVKTLLSNGYFDVIKGNENEIMTVFGATTTQQKGVDSGASTSGEADKVWLVKALAARERNVVLMTGKTDYLSDGDRTYAIKNGHAYLGRITGSGCTLGTTIAAFLTVHKEDRLLAALAGILMFEIAAEQAAARDDVKGPGTFVPAFIDQLFQISADAAVDDSEWLEAAKVEKL
jgi:thiamine-phosphate diphosphorylase/hydroxyethylthiazole kinase